MLFIDNDLVTRLLSMKETIEVQEQAFRALDTGLAIHRPRIDMYAPAGRPDGYYRWGTMEGASRKIGVFAGSIGCSGASSFLAARSRGGCSAQSTGLDLEIPPRGGSPDSPPPDFTDPKYGR